MGLKLFLGYILLLFIFYLNLFKPVNCNVKTKFQEKVFELCRNTSKSLSSLSNVHYGIIQSPNYPNNYSKTNECVINLRAPKNHIIKLKFDENFNLEPSIDCIHDYLEIRNGPHGYSPLIGKFCGSTTPENIISSGRDLWIRFNSDDSIQLSGFRTYYEFKRVQNMNNNIELNEHKTIECEIYKTSNDLHMNADDIITNIDIEKHHFNKYNELRAKVSEESTNNNNKYIILNDKYVECTINIELEKNDKLLLNFEKVNISSSSLNINKGSSEIKQSKLDCADNFIQIYDGSTSIIDRQYQFCVSDTNKLYKSKTNRIFIRYLLNRTIDNNYVSFKLIYNAYKIGPCDDTQFDCLDNTCINATLICNGKRNCNHSVDEIGCSQSLNSHKQKKTSWTPEQKFAFLHKIIISTIGTVLAIVIIISITISCKRSIKDSKNKRKELETFKLIQERIEQQKIFSYNNNNNNNNIMIHSNLSSDSLTSNNNIHNNLKHNNVLSKQNKDFCYTDNCNNDINKKSNKVNETNTNNRCKKLSSLQSKMETINNKDNIIHLQQKLQIDTNPDNYSLNLSDIDIENDKYQL